MDQVPTQPAAPTPAEGSAIRAAHGKPIPRMVLPPNFAANPISQRTPRTGLSRSPMSRAEFARLSSPHPVDASSADRGKVGELLDATSAKGSPTMRQTHAVAPRPDAARPGPLERVQLGQAKQVARSVPSARLNRCRRSSRAVPGRKVRPSRPEDLRPQIQREPFSDIRCPTAAVELSPIRHPETCALLSWALGRSHANSWRAMKILTGLATALTALTIAACSSGGTAGFPARRVSRLGAWHRRRAWPRRRRTRARQRTRLRLPRWQYNRRPLRRPHGGESSGRSESGGATTAGERGGRCPGGGTTEGRRCGQVAGSCGDPGREEQRRAGAHAACLHSDLIWQLHSWRRVLQTGPIRSDRVRRRGT